MSEADNGLLGGGPAASGPPPAVSTRLLSKRFGAVPACDAVDIEIHRGEIHGILGENGAGKSTLMKMLIGLVVPDSGSILVDGVSVRIADPVAAASLGIGMVHQHFSLVEALTVWENVALGDTGRLSQAGVRNAVGELSERYGLRIDPDARVADLPVGLRQRVEILKCLRREPEILIFDEPTSVLTPEESENLFRSLRGVVEREGRSVALVSHKLTEMLEVTDRVTIMRNGLVVDRYMTADADAGMLARAMVGRDVRLRSTDAPQAIPALRGGGDGAVSGVDSPVLEFRNVEVREPGGSMELDDLTFSLGPGEILGLAGVEGNGQRVVADLLSGLRRPSSGEIFVDGVEVDVSQAGAALRAGIAVIPEDRHDSGIVLEMSVAENLILSNQSGMSTRGIIDGVALAAAASDMIDRFSIMCTGPAAPMWTLSGGNQQRVVLAREITADPTVLVAAQPTRGLDVGAIEYMTDQLRQVAGSGVGILLISSELDEILEMADRIVVIFGGQLTGEMVRSEATREKIGRLMGGDLL
ncbi:MAG: ABC transporter ATP-binding protein [SAR202 cluster bacterium]|nr:ABC transporter ATP-binding protein [SAR202 cluster bacterium]